MRLSEAEVDQLDQIVKNGNFKSRSEAIKSGLDLLTKEQREEWIAASYREAYTKHPQEEWIGEVGEKLMAEVILAREAEEKNDKSG